LSFFTIILAGGKSKRMGTNKSTLKIKGKPLITHIINSLTVAGCTNFIIQVKSKKDKDIIQPLVSNFNISWNMDNFEDGDVIKAIYSGLVFAKEKGWEAVQLVPIDTPYVSAKLFEILSNKLKKDLDVIIPKSNYSDYGLEPLLSHLKTGSAIKKLKENIEGENKSLGKIFTEMKHEIINSQELIKLGVSNEEFKNLNYPEDV